MEGTSIGAYIVTARRDLQRYDKGQFIYVHETKDGERYPETGLVLVSRVICNNPKSWNWLKCRETFAVEWEDDGLLLTTLRETESKSKVLTDARELKAAEHDGSGRGR